MRFFDVDYEQVVHRFILVTTLLRLDNTSTQALSPRQFKKVWTTLVKRTDAQEYQPRAGTS